MSKRCRAYTEPIWANCTSHSGCTSALAPASSNTVGRAPGTGIGVAIAGRLTPLIRPIRRSADAIAAPVLPADTIADALPSRTASAARTSDESFLRRTPCAGSSCISMTSLASISSKSPRSSVAGPTSATGIPASAASRAPAMISSGARSPPIASSAIGSTSDQLSMSRSGDLDRDAVAVPAAAGAHRVRQLGVAAAGADAAGRGAELPRTGAAAARLGLRLLLLGNSHRANSVTTEDGARTNPGCARLSGRATMPHPEHRSGLERTSQRRRAPPSGGRPARSLQPHSPAFRLAPQTPHSPAQSGRHSGASGSSSSTASRTSGTRFSWSLSIGNASGSVTAYW